MPVRRFVRTRNYHHAIKFFECHLTIFSRTTYEQHCFFCWHGLSLAKKQKRNCIKLPKRHQIKMTK